MPPDLAEILRSTLPDRADRSEPSLRGWGDGRDIIANISVLLAAGAVSVFGSAWPDIVVGVGIAALFLASAVGMLRSGLDALQRAASGPAILR